MSNFSAREDKTGAQGGMYAMALYAGLIMRSIRYHWRLHLGLLAGTFLVCAALSGALVVGDSVRQTLRGIADRRLGAVEYALDWGNRYFDSALADRMRERLNKHHTSQPERATGEAPGPLVAALGLRGMAETPLEREDEGGRVNRAWVYGVDAGFWALAPEPGPVPQPGPQEALINEATARALALEAGDDMILRMPRPSLMPLDAPLARGGSGDTAVVRVRIAAVVTESQWGRFSLATDQAVPFNIFVDHAWLAELVELDGKANLLLAGTGIGADRLERLLRDSWRLESIGLRAHEHASGIVQLESERIFIEEAVVNAGMRVGDARPTLSYLVNSIRAGARSTPYSFVVAGTAPKTTPRDAVAINEWLAETLEAGPDDLLEITWSEPLPSGEYAERSVETRVHDLLSMEAVTVERDLAPRFPGLSDVDSCRDWDIGLPLDDDKLLDQENEAYWKAYGQTPKLLTTYETGVAWWGTHFGAVTALRFPAEAGDADALSDQLLATLNPEALGLLFLPAREQAARAVEQALDFGLLFVGMSMFLIAAALILLALLHVHGLQMRAGELGALLAMGWRRRRVAIWLGLESLPTLCAGAVTGAPGGAAYARALLYGLLRFWPDAVAGAPLRYHASADAMLQGALIAGACVLTVIGICAALASRKQTRELLERDFRAQPTLPSKRALFFPLTLLISLPVTLFALYQGLRGAAENPSLWFFVSGASALTAILSGYGLFLGSLAHGDSATSPRLWRIMLRQLARRRGRSLSVAAVTGCGVFMVMSVTAMQAAMDFDPTEPASGTGGFSVFATTTAPMRVENGQLLGFDGKAIVPLRLWDGDDAGCLNLNQAQTPRVYGVSPESMIARKAFAPPDDVEALWSMLNMSLGQDVVPALVGDTDTALWGLQAVTHPENGTEFAYRDDAGKAFRVRVVGRLPMRLSLFQGALLISEDQFTRRFPHEGGYRAFLLDAADAAGAAARLNREHGRLGMEAVTSQDRLRAFHAVERAYLAMFLALGGLGLMLGAGGAAVVVLRGLAERRAEFALFIAVGYEPRAVRRMALFENILLVIGGLLPGTVAAALAVMPVLFHARADLDRTAALIVWCALIAVYLIAALTTTRLFLRRIPLSALRTE